MRTEGATKTSLGSAIDPQHVYAQELIMTTLCPFCMENRAGKASPLLTNRSTYLLNTDDPVLRCSGMVIPYRHVSTPFELTQDELIDTFDLLGRAKSLFDVEGAEGYNIGWNVGPVGGQTVPHLHLHIIGRFSDEPLVGQGIRHHLKQPANQRPFIE